MSARQEPLSWARDFSSVLRPLGAPYPVSKPLADCMNARGSSLTTNTGVLIEPRRVTGVERLP